MIILKQTTKSLNNLAWNNLHYIYHMYIAITQPATVQFMIFDWEQWEWLDWNYIIPHDELGELGTELSDPKVEMI